MDEDVAAAERAVHDVVLVQVAESEEHLSGVFSNNLLLLQRTYRSDRSSSIALTKEETSDNMVMKTTNDHSNHVLHENIKVSVVLVDAQVSHNVWMRERL